MAFRQLRENIYCLSSMDWNRRSFDELVPLHEGTSYNSYLIRGSEKTVLVDTDEPRMMEELLSNLKALGVEKLDYIVSNHAEQDHSGSIPKLLELYPAAKVVTNAKCKALLIEHLLIAEDRFQVVADRETLSLGGFTLEFILYPWVHWPETMFTWIREPQILLSCDLFGAHYADTQKMMAEENEIAEGAYRYFCEIMYPFRDNIANSYQKILDLKPRMIGPSHGPVYANPEPILNAYKEWTSPAVKNRVVIPYISMHGSTEKMVHYLTEALEARGIEVKPFFLSVTDIGNLAMQAADAATVIPGVSQVLGGMHPQMAYAIYFYNLLRPKTKFVSVVGSYGWGGKMLEQIQGMLYNVKAEMIPPVVVKGYPKEGDFKLLDALADSVLEKHRGLGLL